MYHGFDERDYFFSGFDFDFNFGFDNETDFQDGRNYDNNIIDLVEQPNGVFAMAVPIE